jgi:hypothetical protein
MDDPKTIPPGTTDSDLTVYHFPGKPGENQIRFQNGAMELGRNGATTEEVLDCLIAHIEYFQRGKYACRENALMITKLEEAKMWLGKELGNIGGEDLNAKRDAEELSNS